MIHVSRPRGRSCRRCGKDDWYTGQHCAVCDRAGARRRAARRRQSSSRNLWEIAKQRAVQLHVPFTITVDDVARAFPPRGVCPILHLRLARGVGFAGDASPSLDRLNPRWGYEPGNIAVISLRANRAKSNLHAYELDAIAQWMRTHGLD